MKYVKAFPLVLVALLVTSLVSAVPRTRGGGGGGGAGPTATIAVPTSMATTGNAINLTTLGGSPSQATHDSVVCCIEHQNSSDAIFAGAAMTGWYRMGLVNAWNGSASVWLDLIGHQVTSEDPKTYTMTGLTNSNITDTICDLVRNTHGPDLSTSTSNNGAAASTTVTYPTITTVTANDMLFYCSVWGAANNTTQTFPGGVTVDQNIASVAATVEGYALGHAPQAAPSAVPSALGTLNHSETSAGTVGALTP